MRVIAVLVSVAMVLASASAAKADEPSVSVGESLLKNSIEVSAGKGGKDPGVVPLQVKHGTGGTQAPGEIVCHDYFDGEIFKSCWNPSPEDCFGQGLDTNAGVNRCPTAQPPTPRPPPPAALSARDYAINYFRSLPLPVPQPKMSAPEGICGARHTLDLQIPSQLVFTDPTTPFGSLAVHVHGRFTVNWGDGRTDTYTSSGAPWPRSILEHYWENVGRYDIAVTAHWSADWTYGNHSGSLAGLSTTNTIEDWRVIELQAVLIE